MGRFRRNASFMAQHTPHARLISEAARTTLGPLGLTQWGRTRLWIDDRRWHLGLVEFEADGLTRGCSLMVGVMWLWSRHDRFRFDLGRRVQRFISFRNKSQFEREAHRLAERAAEAVLKQRVEISSVAGAVAATADAVEHSIDIGTLFDSAVAAGLYGNADRARDLFARIAAEPQRTPRDQALAADAALLLKDLSDAAVFRLAVEQRVVETRRTLRLPVCNESLSVAESEDAPPD